MHALGAQSIHGDGERERGVDAAGEPHDDAGKAVLRDVVAHPHDERAVHALIIGELGGDGRRLRRDSPGRVAREFHHRGVFDKGGRARHEHAVRVHDE